VFGSLSLSSPSFCVLGLSSDLTKLMATDAKPEAKKPFLIIYSLDREHKQHSFSVYVTKLQLRLRHGGVPYENDIGNRGDSPKKKFPYVRFLETGELMGDSALITERLVRDGKLEDLSAQLSPEQKAMDLCLRVMVEDRLYYLVVSDPSVLSRPE